MQNKINLGSIVSNWDEYKVDLLQKGIIPGKDNRALIPETQKVIEKFCGLTNYAHGLTQHY